MASSSSPMTKKTTKFSQIRRTLFQKPSSLKAISLFKRRKTVFKKARELSTLCGIEVCVIHYGSYGELKTWPKEREKVKDMALRYIQLSDTKRRKGRVDLQQVLEKINKDDSKKNKKKKVNLGSNYKYPDWDPRFDNCSVEELTELIQSLERRQTVLQHRIRAVVESDRQRSMRYMNMANQEPAMNHHRQQHSNQVSMDLYNHGIGTLPQPPVSTSAFNQAQSLAPLPNSLTMCENPNMERYSSLLGTQETWTDEFMSTNMLPYNSFNTNCGNNFPPPFNQNCGKVEDYSFPGVHGTGRINNMNVEDYFGSLWAQGTGINGFQNMDMYGSNNNNNNNTTNGLSHQLVQFPAQRAAPVFQYMDQSTQNMRFDLSSQCLL